MSRFIFLVFGSFMPFINNVLSQPIRIKTNFSTTSPWFIWHVNIELNIYWTFTVRVKGLLLHVKILIFGPINGIKKKISKMINDKRRKIYLPCEWHFFIWFSNTINVQISIHFIAWRDCYDVLYSLHSFWTDFPAFQFSLAITLPTQSFLVDLFQN